jgi:hypothetical protein
MNMIHGAANVVRKAGVTGQGGMISVKKILLWFPIKSSARVKRIMTGKR